MPSRVSTSPTDNQTGYVLKSFLGSPSTQKISSASTTTDVIGYEPQSKPRERLFGTRTSASAWVDGCGVARPHNGGIVPEHCDSMNLELVTLRGSIHHDLGHGDGSCAIKVRNGLVICMSPPESGAEECKDGVVWKHSRDGWRLVGFHVHLKKWCLGPSIVKGMKGKC